MTDQSIAAVEPPREMFRGRLIRVATQRMRLADGTEKTFEFAERAPGVRVLVTVDGYVLLTKEWRSQNQAWDYRLPGGKVFDSLAEYLGHQETVSPGLAQAALRAAQKELSEETSLRVPLEGFREYHRSVCGATVVWDLHYFLVELPLRPAVEAEITTDEGERTHPQWFSFEEVRRLCVAGHVREDRTVAVLLRYLLARTIPQSP